jgi:hypothetical protein
VPTGSAGPAAAPETKRPVPRRRSREGPALDNLGHLYDVWHRLKVAGRAGEILDAEGKIRPSPGALAWVERNYPGAPPEEKAGLAKIRTVLELAEKYKAELA